MTRTTLITLVALSLSSAALASTAGGSWQDDVAAAMQAADPDGGWEIAPIPTTAAAKTKADILIESFRDGSTEASYHGDVTLKRGILAATSTDGAQGLVLLDDVLVCDWELGCEPLRGVEPDEIDVAFDAGRCHYPFCGGDAVTLAQTYPVYVVVDISVGRDGSESWTVSDLLVGFDLAFRGIEPDEID